MEIFTVGFIFSAVLEQP